MTSIDHAPIDPARSDPNRARDLRPLDAIRGVAALLVVIFHHEMQSQFSYFSDATLFGASLRTLFKHGYLAVDMFLVLSGYILARKYGDLRLDDRFTWRAYADFLAKRFARVYPLYVFMTLVVLVVWQFEPSHNVLHWPPEMFERPWGTILSNLLLVQAWGLAPSLDAPAWTLSAECLGYLAFPLLTAWLLAGGRFVFIVNFALVMGLITVLWWSTLDQDKTYDLHDYDDPRTILRAFAGFALGILAWRFEALELIGRMPQRLRIILPSAGVVFVVAAMASPGREWLIMLSFAVLLVALSTAGQRTQHILNTPILFTAGYLSYAVYLIHDQMHPFRRLLEQLLAPIVTATPAHIAAGLLTIAASYTLAAVAYAWLEKPARAMVMALWYARRLVQPA